MTGSELKTIREGLGLSADWMAERLGVSLRSYRYWEASDEAIKQDACDLIVKLDNAVDDAVEAAMAVVESANMERVVLIRYKSEEDLWRFRKDMVGLPLSIHNAMLYRLRKKVVSKGIACIVKWLLAKEYLSWLSGAEDTESMRAAWATSD